MDIVATADMCVIDEYLGNRAFTTRTFGHFLLAGAAFWMMCGLLIMRKMINFKF